MEESAQAEMADFLEIIFGDWSNPNAYMDKPISNIDHPWCCPCWTLETVEIVLECAHAAGKPARAVN